MSKITQISERFQVRLRAAKGFSRSVLEDETVLLELFEK
jgi:hypothetical protein